MADASENIEEIILAVEEECKPDEVDETVCECACVCV